MISETFAQGRSIIHRSHPGLRLVLAVVFSFLVALMQDVTALLVALVFAVILCLAAALPALPLLKRMAVAGGLLVLVWLVVPWVQAYDPLVTLGPLAVGRSGVLLCLQITLKTFAIILTFTALVATMHLATLGQTLHGLGAPSKLVHLLLLAYRYIFVLEQEYQRLYRAAKMRNFRPATNSHTYRTYAYLVGMLFVRASERANRVYQAMLCRGFNGRFFALQRYAPTLWNPVLASIVLLISGILIYLEWIV
jgi:cobalt/nickel transport system permease protein